MAAYGNNVVVKGLKELERDFKRIDRKVPSKVLAPAVRKAIVPIHKQAKKNAKWKSIRKLIKRKTERTRSRNVVQGKIYVDDDKGSGGKDGEGARQIRIDGRMVNFSVVAKILEFGRAAPYDKGGAKVVKPVPFMRNARKQKEPEAMRILDREVANNALFRNW